MTQSSDVASDFAIVTDGLSRSFRTYEKEPGFWGSVQGIWNRKYTEKMALQPTSLKIQSGKIVGLVGANGAGKTTLLKLLSGLVHPTSGSATVLGFKPWERRNEYLRQMSILLGQKNQLWWDIAAADSFQLLGEIYDLDPKVVSQKVAELSEILDCSSVLKTQLRRLSLGERMKMEIIGSLLHSPRVLFLDEPTIGLDIVAQTSIRKFIAEYVKRHHPTVILTSHYMDDISLLADQLLLISKGNIVYNGTVGDFSRNQESLQRLSFSLSTPLGQDLQISGLQLKASQQEFNLQISKEQMPALIGQVTQLQGIQNLKIEEADFEDTIRQFLEKESRVFQTSSRH